MRIPRIYTENTLEEGISLTLEPEASHHLTQVLRLRPGDTITLFNGSGEEYSATLVQLGKQAVTVMSGRLMRTEPRPALEIKLILGISRGERMDFALQKAVELGVAVIQPLFTKRSMVKLQGKRLSHRLAHWQKIVISACEQSGRCRLPVLLDAEYLTATIQDMTVGYPLLLDHRSRCALTDLPPPDQAVTLLVGPEGGLSNEEREMAVKRGFRSVRLGPRILRTETAPLAAIAAMQTLWGDFRGSA